MDATEIARLESELVCFPREFDDCFGRGEPREHPRMYVSAQLSALPRKSVEPVARSKNLRADSDAALNICLICTYSVLGFRSTSNQ